MATVRCEVWGAALSTLQPAHHFWASVWERDRAAAFRRPEDRARSLLAAVLLRAVVARYLGIEPTDVTVDRSCSRCGAAHGRPIIDGGPSVSVSHSGDLVVVAATEHAPIGVDIEAIVHADFADVASTCFTSTERIQLSSPRDVLVGWTRKEAYLKATGEGLTVPLTDVRVSSPSAPAALLERAGGSTVSCAMADLHKWDRHVGTVAVLGAESVHVVERDALGVLAAAAHAGERHTRPSPAPDA